MERRLVSDSLLRSRTSPLLFFLAPSISPFWRSTTASRPLRQLTPTLPSYRVSSIHTTACQRAESPSTAADLDFLEDKERRKPNQSSRSPSSQRRPANDIPENQLNSLLDSVFDSPNLAKRNPSEPVDESSDVMIEKAFRSSMRPREPDKPYQGFARNMQFPPEKAVGQGSPTPLTPYRNLESTTRPAKRNKRTVRSRPTVGRTIEVVPDRGIDVGRALRNLEVACAVNRVRQDLSRQRFHERPGMKRKRLKSERWRKMFKESFKATVMRVREMRRKGW